MPSPFVFWAQSDTHVYLKVDVKEVSRCHVRIEEEGVEFSAVGIGGHGQPMNYEFSVEFYLPVDAEASGYEVGEREVAIKLVKKESDWWPRLLYEQKKLPWLKIDFDRWRDQDESDADEEGNPFAGSGLSSEEMLRQQYPDVFEKLQREELGFISEGKRKVYLFCYNLFMFCGFLYVFLVMSLRYTRDGDDFIPICFKVVGPVMQLLHLLMFLEVLHPMFGYTKVSNLSS